MRPGHVPTLLRHCRFPRADAERSSLAEMCAALDIAKVDISPELRNGGSSGDAYRNLRGPSDAIGSRTDCLDQPECIEQSYRASSGDARLPPGGPLLETAASAARSAAMAARCWAMRSSLSRCSVRFSRSSARSACSGSSMIRTGIGSCPAASWPRSACPSFPPSTGGLCWALPGPSGDCADRGDARTRVVAKHAPAAIRLGLSRLSAG